MASTYMPILGNDTDPVPDAVRYKIGNFVIVFEDIYLAVKALPYHSGKGWRTIDSGK
jgi:hypothetical protein